MSHEIRTPMNTILGMVDVLRGTPLSDRQLEFLRTLEVAGEALMSLLSDILELSTIESGTMQMARVPYDPAEVLRQAEAMLLPQAEAKGLALLTQAAPDLPHEAQGDPGRLRQILVNLLGNAVKFTPRGEIRAAVRSQEGHGGRPELLYTVTDTGIGIEPDKQQSIFEPFTQLDSSTTRAYGGSGLGLAIQRPPGRGHGRTAVVDSQPARAAPFPAPCPWIAGCAQTRPRTPLPPCGPRPRPNPAPWLPEACSSWKTAHQTGCCIRSTSRNSLSASSLPQPATKP
jgi:signal transduction histidine kinase